MGNRPTYSLVTMDAAQLLPRDRDFCTVTSAKGVASHAPLPPSIPASITLHSCYKLQVSVDFRPATTRMQLTKHHSHIYTILTGLMLGILSRYINRTAIKAS